jgi:hypothetical protein
VSKMRYRKRRRYGLGDYRESDRDYLANNSDLAVSLLDNYGAIMSGEVLSVKHIKRQYAQARKALNDYVEAEMRRIMQTHKGLTCLLKCMGDLIAYDKVGPMSRAGDYNNTELRAVTKLADFLSEYDRAYYCQTGHPLRLTRMTDGAIKEDRHW